MNIEIDNYNKNQDPTYQEICNAISTCINTYLPKAENKIWHAHPVWFIEGNTIVGYSVLKNCVRLLFWSGQSFNEEKLINEGKFKAAQFDYTSMEQVNEIELQGWLQKSIDIQWDYKNLIKRKGELIRLK